MKSLLGMVILSLGCAQPTHSPEQYRPLIVDYLEYWEPTLKALPSGFRFPSDLAATEKVVIEVDTQIDIAGHPTGAKAVAQTSALAIAAEGYVMECEFQPAKFDGKWTACTFRIRVIFNTQKQEINLRTNNDKPFRPLDNKEGRS